MNPIIQALVSHCEAWLSKFTTLLANLAMREVAELQKYVTSSSAELTQLLIPSKADQVCLSIASRAFTFDLTQFLLHGYLERHSQAWPFSGLCA